MLSSDWPWWRYLRLGNRLGILNCCFLSFGGFCRHFCCFFSAYILDLLLASFLVFTELFGYCLCSKVESRRIHFFTCKDFKHHSINELHRQIC